MRAWIPLLTVLAVTACSGPTHPFSKAAPAVAADPAGAAADAAGPALVEPPPKSAEKPATASPPTVAMLAYAYNFGLEVAAGDLRGLVARHQGACAAAGPAVCQVTGSSVNVLGNGMVKADLSLRATPVWVTAFKAGLAAQARSAHGQVTEEGVTSEDLSQNMVDTEAHLRAKTALRDRLQGLLNTHSGAVHDLVDLEKSLSEAQGELDTLNAELTMMRQRVATSVVQIHYTSAGVFAPHGVWSPLADALHDFVGGIAGSLAVMVGIFAALLPWAVIVGGGMWLLRRRLPKWRLGWRRKGPPTA